jgi:hypothetical protein
MIESIASWITIEPQDLETWTVEDRRAMKDDGA